MRKPFFKPGRLTWYCEIDRKQITLVKGDKEATRKEAEAKYHQLMAGREPITDRTSVAVLIDTFLAWTKENKAERTYDWYLWHCQRFTDFIGCKLTVDALKPDHVTRWLASKYKGTSGSYKNGACRAVVRALNWARKQCHIKANPLEGMERDAAESREIWLTDDQWESIVAQLKPGDPFNDYIWFLHETGCRPQEIRILSKKHWNETNRLTLERKDSKGKKHNRVIYLNQRAQEIVSRLAVKHPQGALFRNTKGNAWTKSKIIDRFRALRKKTDIAGLIAYTLRHTWITNALKRGVDVATVARLAGHKDSTMVLRVYGHHAKDEDFIAAKLRIATNEPRIDVPQESAAG